MSDWTDDRVELLKKHWQNGLTCSQIARLLGGVTRNAVIGKLTRLGCAGRHAASLPARILEMRKPKLPKPPKPVLSVLHTGMTHTAEIRAEGLPPERADKPATCFDLLSLGAHMCRWPIGDPREAGFGFCGRRCGDGSYCRSHARVSYCKPAIRDRVDERLGVKEARRA